MLTPEELQAIRSRSTFVPDGTGAAWMRYTSPAPEDRAALLAHIDALNTQRDAERDGWRNTRIALTRLLEPAFEPDPPGLIDGVPGGGALVDRLTMALAGATDCIRAMTERIDALTAFDDAWNAGASAACARLPRDHVLKVYDERTQPDLFRAWLGGWDADAWAPGGPEYAARQEQIDALTPRWLPAPPIVPPETEAWVWMEHCDDPVRVRACREGAADVLWWDDDEIEVEDPPYQRAVGWRLWVGNGEGRRWAPCTGRPG